MKKLLIPAAVLLAAGLSAGEVWRSNFTKRDPAFVTNGQVKDGILITTGRYHFATISLAPSEKNLKVTLNLTGRDGATFGAGLYDVPIKKRFLLPIWAKAVNGKQTLVINLPADKLQVPSKLLIYNVSKKGGLQVESILVEDAEDEQAKSGVKKKLN